MRSFCRNKPPMISMLERARATLRTEITGLEELVARLGPELEQQSFCCTTVPEKWWWQDSEKVD